jgi:hypothetical protein
MDILSTLSTNSLVVFCGRHAAREQATAAITGLVLRGPVTVLDNGNRFQPYRVARLLRFATQNVAGVAQRLIVRRAFTCYQTLALLEGTPSFNSPYVLLDLLANFYDEGVAVKEVSRILTICMRNIERLKAHAPVLVTLSPARIDERAFLLEELFAAADRVLFDADSLDDGRQTQPSLFDYTEK